MNELIYHVYPRKGWALDLNFSILPGYYHLFDRIRVGVAVDHTTYSASAIQHLFPDRTEIYEYPNKCPDCESLTLCHFLPTIREIGYTFYGQCKGVTRDCNRALMLWIRLLYEKNLTTVPDMTDHVCSGILRRFDSTVDLEYHAKHNVQNQYQWHYSGTFFWINNQKLRMKTNWQYVQPGKRFAVEYYLGNHVTRDEALCSFGDGVSDKLSDIKNWNQITGIR